MSVRITSKIWDNAQNVKSERLLVLLALADWANDEGKCWPNMATIAGKARTSKDGAAKIVAWLEKEGYLTVRRGIGRGNQSHYIVHPTPIKGDAEQPFSNNGKGDAETPFKEEKGDPEKAIQKQLKGDPETEKATQERLKGDPEFQGTIRNARVNRYEPSVGTVSEPSGGTPPQKNQSPEKRPNTDSPLAMELRNVCKKTIILSPNDKTKMEQALMILEAENATVAQMQEFGQKVKLHWIGRDSKTKQPRAPGILQVAENWKDVLDIDENAQEIITGGQNANIPRMPTRVAHDDASLRRYAARKQAEAQAL